MHCRRHVLFSLSLLFLHGNAVVFMSQRVLGKSYFVQNISEDIGN